MKDMLEILDAVVDKVLAYKPKRKKKRHNKRATLRNKLSRDKRRPGL
jgi:hypothetical protein